MTSAVWLHQREEKQNSESRLKKLSEDQFLLAAQTRPTRFRARWQQSYFDGPMARREAEEALRSKWVETLTSLLRGTPTPMGELLNKGAGRQTSHDTQSERTYSQEVYRLVDSGSRSCVPVGSPTPFRIPADEALGALYTWRLEEYSPSPSFHGGHRGGRSETHTFSSVQHHQQGALVQHSHRRQPETSAAVPDSHGPSARRLGG